MAFVYTAIDKCRISGSNNLISVLKLGNQELTGVFPSSKHEPVAEGPLELVWCPDSGLLQLAHSFDPSQMYGENYGYRSGLNQSMVRHLTNKAGQLERLANLRAGDIVLDIGSNDATFLKAYKTPGIERTGIDPTAAKFSEYYTDDIRVKADFFNAKNYHSLRDHPAKIVTSIAMFYDLDDPIAFARDIADVLAPDGVWHFEQSYMPAMLRTLSYDTICHEHIEYYSLGAVRRILDAAGMKIVDVQMNAINGGSFAVTAAKATDAVAQNSALVDWLLAREEAMGLGTPKPYRDFEERTFRHRADLTKLVKSLVKAGKRVLGYGASTKGNVTLQFCGLTDKDILAIAEVNPEKFGSYTPGSRIPIVSEAEARAMKPDYFLVLPWHFRDGILQREQEYIASGGRFIFPFPEIEVV
jgi:hypothetical protein